MGVTLAEKRVQRLQATRRSILVQEAAHPSP